MLAIDQHDEIFIGDSILKDFLNCSECGLCCSFFDDLIIYAEEIKNAANRLSLDEETFRSRFTKAIVGNDRSLLTPCPFVHENKCTIYNHRFFVCKAFPLCINLTKNQGILSGIYVCPQATQFYEGLLDFYKKNDENTYQFLLSMEEKVQIDEKGMKVMAKASLFSPYLDYLTTNQK